MPILLIIKIIILVKDRKISLSGLGVLSGAHSFRLDCRHHVGICLLESLVSAEVMPFARWVSPVIPNSNKSTNWAGRTDKSFTRMG